MAENEQDVACMPETAEAVPAPVCYFGTNETFRVELPDGVQYIEHRKLTEGDRKEYQNTSTVEQKSWRNSDQTSMVFKAGTERHKLLELAICGWNLNGPDGRPVGFSPNELARFLKHADPDIIELIEADIRKNNKWLLLDQMDVQAIEKEIELLNERLVLVKEREAKNLS